MADNPTFTTQPRQNTGSRPSREARNAGQIPVNLYGKGESNESLLVDGHALEMALLGPSQIFQLLVGDVDQACLVREVQYDTFGQKVLHVDFTRVDLSEEVEVDVILEVKGTPKGAAEGGILTTLRAALSVRCRADSIPENFVVDVSELEIGQAIHAGDIELPAGVVLDTGKQEEDESMVSVIAPRIVEEEEEEVLEGEEGEEGEEGAEGEEGEEAEGGDEGEAAPADEGDEPPPADGE